MIDSDPAPPTEISFAREVGRKATHTGALVIPCGYYFLDLDRSTMLAIMVPVALISFLIDVARLRGWTLWRGYVGRILTPILRQREMNHDFTGATYILATVCIVVALFDRPVVIAALAFIMLGDTLAALVGRRFGRHRFFRNKSLEGSAAFLIGALAVAWVAPGLNTAPALIGAVVATIVEALPLGVDDNVSVPVFSALVMTLSDTILTHFS